MQKRHVDVAVIGAGSAGLSAWHKARKDADDVLLIEAGEYGTTCARVGCMPSKLLIAAADAAHRARQASTFGVKVAEVEVDGEAVEEIQADYSDGDDWRQQHCDDGAGDA